MNNKIIDITLKLNNNTKIEKTNWSATRLLQTPLWFVLFLDSQWRHLETVGVT